MEVAREIREVVHPFQRLSNFRDVGDLNTAEGRRFFSTTTSSSVTVIVTSWTGSIRRGVGLNT